METIANLSGLVDEVKGKLSQHLPMLTDVAADIHANPEIRFTEVHAAKRLSKELESRGFSVERGFAGLETAFVGRWATSDADDDSPTIAIFCEYDALEGIGHACGHNIIAACGLGAGLLVKDALEAAPGTPAKVVVVGSPGEEGAAGKVPMIAGGVLDDIDLALMVHPTGEDQVNVSTLARVALDVSFKGRASHAAAAPELGRNALDAATLALNAIGLLRQQIPDGVRIHTIITDGGQAPNIIPEHTGLRAFVRAGDSDYLLSDIVPRVKKCIEGAAIATDCEATVEENTPPYLSLVSNPVLVEIADEAFRLLGRTPGEGGPVGSTDMGNVSQQVPSIHPMICLSPGLTPHTREFASAAGGDAAAKTIADGAVILAATAMAAFREPEIVTAAKEAFEKD
ncbi:M20 family metallopeptidase [Arthrobacter pigmenti]